MHVELPRALVGKDGAVERSVATIVDSYVSGSPPAMPMVALDSRRVLVTDRIDEFKSRVMGRCHIMSMSLSRFASVDGQQDGVSDFEVIKQIEPSMTFWALYVCMYGPSLSVLREVASQDNDPSSQAQVLTRWGVMSLSNAVRKVFEPVMESWKVRSLSEVVDAIERAGSEQIVDAVSAYWHRSDCAKFYRIDAAVLRKRLLCLHDTVLRGLSTMDEVRLGNALHSITEPKERGYHI